MSEAEMQSRYEAAEDAVEKEVQLRVGRIRELLHACYPFLVHAACTIPDDNLEYKKAHELMKEIDPIVHPEVHAALEAFALALPEPPQEDE